jgi:cell division protein FtsQ
MAAGMAAGLAVVTAGVIGVRFALWSPRVALADLEQIQVGGNQFVPRSAVLEKFTADLGRSVLRIPLDERRAALEEIPWIESASVQRVLPNRLRVNVVERTPVAFLRAASELALIDAQGVILERPLEGEFAFPVVTGIGELTPREERRRKMQLFVQFLRDVQGARPGSAEHISEVDLSDKGDLRAVLAGLPEFAAGDSPVQQSLLVHFGEGDFAAKFRTVVDNVGEWRASVGRLVSVDLRFRRQVVVNPEGSAVAQAPGAPGTRQP